MKMPVVPENRILRCGILLVRRYLRHRVGTQSAALAFYLLFMLFPFLIFISALLGMLHLDVTAILQGISEFLPDEVVDFIGVYLTYVGKTSNSRLLLFGLVFSIYFPMRTTNVLMRAVRTAYHLGPPQKSVVHLLKTLVYTGFFIGAIAVTLMLMTVGDRMLSFATTQLQLPPLAADLWRALRFPAIGAVGFFALFLLYALAKDSSQRWRHLWPGTLAALAVWMLLSWMYTWYVEHIAHYSVLYGSIGTVIVLLIWLNMSAVVLIMGAELNGILKSLHKE